MVHVVDVCAVDLIATYLFRYGASVGLKLLRAGALHGVTAADIYAAAAASADPLSSQEDMRQHIATMEGDHADSIVALIPPVVDMGPLLRASAARNFHSTCLLLLDRGADLHQLEERRGRRRGLVDIAAHAAGLDEDWRLVISLLRRGAKPEAPQGVLFSPLRRNDVGLARKLLRVGVVVDRGGLAGLLCDVCAHGATSSAALLLDEVGVPVDALNNRDGDACTDRAIAWHCWPMAEWLVSRGGTPAKPGNAVGHLLDAAGDPVAARVLEALLARGALLATAALAAAVQRGELRLVERLLAAEAPPAPAGRGLVDLALCHGHLRVALALLRHGLTPVDAGRARLDALLHGGSSHPAAAAVIQLLPCCMARSTAAGQCGAELRTAWPAARTPDAAGSDEPSTEALDRQVLMELESRALVPLGA